MRHPKPVEKPRPQIGDFVARDTGGCWCIAKVTGPGWWDFEFFGCACATQEGAEKLATLMNAARDLACGPLLQAKSMYRDSDPKLWTLHCIVSAVGRAIEGPQPELFHEFLERRDTERCAHCEPAPLNGHHEPLPFPGRNAFA